VFGDGLQTRDFTYVGDVVQATLAAAEAHDVTGLVINVGGGAQVSVNEVLEAIAELAGRELDVRYDERQSGDVRDTCADSTLARERLGLAPETDWRDGLRMQWEWMAHDRRAASADS
jgi:UDP-glucose 4-epimerase